ncbi:MAG: DUF599 family protein [Alphaproteobacteria bacterium]|nr:DUF599 family protein [Alphaproteobacteria bacterium]MBU1514412.1 DUF599 family protein [Alphaproteobacteria bacterium]MBU2096056.1 DUF599 family protein [Alphaproteobacteria bacterium]MBU2150098.1 DUF599 family protein [Alphaproteobacteria bacterium]MBU2308611.1 DUF599 family protein [Alphaproteobacteria bacterium]
MQTLDLIALGVFAVAWLFYEPLLTAFGKRRGGVLNTDMTVIRTAWMTQMTGREIRLMDGNLLGHALNSASFFASSNLLLIAAAAGALFGGDTTFRSVSALEVVKTSSRLLFEMQLALVLITLARGLLDFIWSIRQLNYCLAAMGATPEPLAAELRPAYGAVLARLLNPALGAFNSGVRGYYFALAAAAWLFGPWAFMIATLGATSLLFWRQRSSSAATAIHDFRNLIEAKDPGPPSSP